MQHLSQASDNQRYGNKSVLLSANRISTVRYFQPAVPGVRSKVPTWPLLSLPLVLITTLCQNHQEEKYMSTRSNRIFLVLPVAATLLLGTACGGGNGDNMTAESTGGGMSEAPVNPTDSNNGGGEFTLVALDGPRTWSVGPATYILHGADSGLQQNIAGRVIVLVSTDDQDSLTLQLSQRGTGDYTVVDNINLDGGGSRVAFVNVIAGTEVEGLARSRWVSSTGLISVRVDASGGYHATTIEPLTLTRDFDEGTGVPDSPDQIRFTMSNRVAQSM